MRKIDDALEVGIDSFTPPDEIEQNRLIVAIPLLPPQPGNPVPERLRPIRRATIGDLGVKGGKVVILQPNSDLGRHDDNCIPVAYLMVCMTIPTQAARDGRGTALGDHVKIRMAIEKESAVDHVDMAPIGLRQ